MMEKLAYKMKERAAQLDTIFVPPPAAGQQDMLFVDLQGKFWTVMNSYTHGGSMAINRALAGYQEGDVYELLRKHLDFHSAYRRNVQTAPQQTERRPDCDFGQILR